jgi:small subunit ribosomal protein S16
MLAIRLQRVGRRGHAQFRILVQDSRFSAKSGRVVAYLGSYDPHTKAISLDKEKAGAYLTNGARPSERVASILQKEGVKLPGWVKVSQPQKRAIRHPEKLRRNRPPEAKKPEAPKETPAAETEAPEEPAIGTPSEEPVAESAEAEVEQPTPETPAEPIEPTLESPAEEASSPEPKDAPTPEESPSDSTG